MIIALLAAVQFVNVLDFMMVMPLGPDFGRALGIPSSQLGIIAGSYTAVACFSGIVGSFILDRFDRKRALCVTLAGLSVATILGGLSQGLTMLLLSRMLAGFFGGPATSLALSIVSDVVPPEKRGRAMGVVMSSFALASIFGVPAGLELARIGTWHLPFFVVGGLCALVTLLAARVLPSLRGHLDTLSEPKSHPREFLTLPYINAFVMMWLAIFCTFLLVPNLSAFVQFNLHWPRAQLGLLYLGGGALSLLTTRFGGMWIDRVGSARALVYAMGILTGIIFFDVVRLGFPLPAPIFFAGFMCASSFRFVALNTLTSQVPPPGLRARFMSIQSAIQHLGSACGAIVSTLFLATTPEQALVGMDRLALLSILLSWFIPVLAFSLEKRLNRRGTQNDNQPPSPSKEKLQPARAPSG